MRLVLLFVVFGAVIFASCKKGPETVEPEIRETVWKNTHRYLYTQTAVSYNYDEEDEGVQYEEREIDVDVPESDAYLLTLADNGSGRGSVDYGEVAYNHDKSGRFNFDITWGMFGDTLSIRCLAEELCAILPAYGFEPGLGTGIRWYPYRSDWKIEELTENRMVLSMELDVTNFFFWNTEHQFFRYTFEKVEPEEQ